MRLRRALDEFVVDGIETTRRSSALGAQLGNIRTASTTFTAEKFLKNGGMDNRPEGP